MAMSPDGRKLAYTGLGADGFSHVWIRSMDTLESRMLSGTEGAVSLFWSPDSRFVGFGQGTRLKKADATGATPPITLAEIQANVGMGSWSADDVIVFTSRGQGVLRRVSAAGGTPVEITKLGPDETNHSFPLFLPDGRRFLYLRISPNADVRGLYVGAIDAPQDAPASERLLAVQFGASLITDPGSPTGYLVFLREGTLMAQSIDIERVALLGEPIPIAEQVGFGGSGGHFAVSRTALAFRTGGGELRRLLWRDRKGAIVGEAASQGSYLEIALSPDGNRVASYQNDGQFDVWILDLIRKSNARLTFDRLVERWPVWAHDGTYVAFAGSSGTVSGGIFRKRANGSGEPERLIENATAAPQDWSADGRYLLYQVNDPKTATDLWVLPLEGDRKPFPFHVGPFNETQARFSADGQWVVYVSNESGRPEVYVRPFATGNDPQALSGKWMVSNGGGYQPRWRSDGREILYLSPTGQLMSVRVTTSGGSLEADVPERLFDVSIYGGTPIPTSTARWDMTRDGQRFLFNATSVETASAPITIVQQWQSLLKD